jgi:hypothetical protein
MTGAIGCFAPGCVEPVIGQCQGYRGTCGQFYCRTHSVDKLCAACAERKQIDETVERYTRLAETVKRPGGCAYTILIGSAVIIFLMIALPDPRGQNAVSGLVTLGPVVLVTLLYILIRSGNVPKQIAKIEQDNPHFGAFYKEWLMHKKAEDRKYLAGELLGTIGAGIGGAVSGVGDVIKKDIKEAEEDAKWRRRL